MAALIPEWIVEYENIVEVSSFRHLYIAPTKRAWKAQHIQSGVITKVLKGNLKVGQSKVRAFRPYGAWTFLSAAEPKPLKPSASFEFRRILQKKI
jgi:hypothetical protein